MPNLTHSDVQALSRIHNLIGGVHSPKYYQLLSEAQAGNAKSQQELEALPPEEKEPARINRSNLDWQNIQSLLSGVAHDHLNSKHLAAMVSHLSEGWNLSMLDPTARRRLAEHPNLSTELIRNMLTHPKIAYHDSMVKSLMNHPNMTDDTFDSLVNHAASGDYYPSESVTSGLMMNPRLNEQHLHTLLDGNPTYWDKHVAINPAAKADHLAKIIKRAASGPDNGMYADEAAVHIMRTLKHPAATPEHVAHVVDHATPEVLNNLFSVRFGNHLDESLLKKLTQKLGPDHYDAAWREVAHHPKATPEIANMALERYLAQSSHSDGDGGAATLTSPHLKADDVVSRLERHVHENAGDLNRRYNARNVFRALSTRLDGRSDLTREHLARLMAAEDKVAEPAQGQSWEHNPIAQAVLLKDLHKYNRTRDLDPDNPKDQAHLEKLKPVLSRDQIKGFLTGKHSFLAETATAHPHATPDLLQEILNDPTLADGHGGALSSQRLPLDEVFKYAERAPMKARSMAVNNALSTRLHEAMAIHGSPEDHQRILNNPELAALVPKSIGAYHMSGLTPEQVERFWDSGHKSLKNIAMSSKHAKPEWIREILRQATHPYAKESLQSRRYWHRKLVSEPDSIMPDDLHKRSVHIRFDANKLRTLRDHIEGKGGTVHKKDLEKAGLYNNNFGKLLDPKGNLTSAKLQEAIDKLPTARYNLGFSLWPSMQRHNTKPSKVMTLNLTNDHVAKLKEQGLWDFFKDLNQQRNSGGHPTHPHTLGWARWTGHPKSGIFVDEMQSDLWRPTTQYHFDRYHKNFLGDNRGIDIETDDGKGGKVWKRANRRSLDVQHEKSLANDPELKDMPDGEAKNLLIRKKNKAHMERLGKLSRASFYRENPAMAEDEAKHKKVMDILFNGRHPGEVLLEGLHQYLRDKGYSGAKIATHSVPTKYQISLNANYPSKEEIEADPTKDAPVHMKEEYDQIPQKVFGWKKGKYGIGDNKATKEEVRVRDARHLKSAKEDKDVLPLQPHQFLSVEGKQKAAAQAPAGGRLSIKPGDEIHEGIVRKIAAIRELMRKIKEP